MLRRYLLPKFVRLRTPGLVETLDGFLKSQYRSRRELIAIQEEKLQRLIEFAYREVPYYRDKFAELHLVPADIRHLEDLQKLPVLGKEDIKDIRKFGPGGGILGTFTRTTSGSTGAPRKVMVSREAALIETALFYRFLFSMGYEWGDRIIQLWGSPIVRSGSPIARLVESVRTSVSRRIHNVRRFDTYKVNGEAIAEVVSLVRDNTPQILRGYTSSVYATAVEMIRKGIGADLKGITTTAEKLFDYQRIAIEKAFGPKVYDQYGCGESNSIAFECEKHTGLHVASEHVVLELLDDGGKAVGAECGRVTITDLDNYAMPLIRYENGDLAKWAKNECPCGRGLPLLEEIEGRIYEMLDVPGNRRIHGGFFDEIYVELGFGDRYRIDDLRVVQEDLYNYKLEFVMDGTLSAEDIRELKRKYAQYLGDVNVEVSYVEEIPATKAGKRQFIFARSAEASLIQRRDVLG
jgi:phenylacetate-CoA ligase